ncbi:MAG: hypothetical protein LBN10_04255, partial [Propionibacteriaceae bacterium]|nr:hypothetical protein [Propionibacteriaceae bacterium]
GQTTWFLADAQTGREVYDYNPIYGGTWTHGTGRITTGFDPEGIFVKEDGVDVFRAMRAKQRIIGHMGDTAIVRFTADNGDAYTSPAIGFGRDEDHDWEVVSRPLVADDIPCFETLRKLFQASIETNNPVYWC